MEDGHRQRSTGGKACLTFKFYSYTLTAQTIDPRKQAHKGQSWRRRARALLRAGISDGVWSAADKVSSVSDLTSQRSGGCQATCISKTDMGFLFVCVHCAKLNFEYETEIWGSSKTRPSGARATIYICDEAARRTQGLPATNRWGPDYNTGWPVTV